MAVIKEVFMRGYFKHLFANWKVALKCFILFIFHFVHGVIPCKLTEHERYKI
jgi:hypothetical protein